MSFLRALFVDIRHVYVRERCEFRSRFVNTITSYTQIESHSTIQFIYIPFDIHALNISNDLPLALAEDYLCETVSVSIIRNSQLTYSRLLLFTYDTVN